jgi:hypothetical protein
MLKPRDVLILTGLALIEGLTHFGAWMGDSNGYITIVHFFLGTATKLEWLQTGHWHGYLRPLIPAFASPLAMFINGALAISIVNLVFLVFGTLFTYQLTQHFTGNSFYGLLGGILYASAAPNLIWGVAVLTDGPGYAMVAFGFYWILVRHKTTIGNSIVTGLLLAFSLLIKETTIILVFFLGIQIALDRSKQNWRSIMSFMLVSVIALGLASAWGILVVGKTYLTFYNEGIVYSGGQYAGALAHPQTFLRSILGAFYLTLIFAILGFTALTESQTKDCLRIIIASSILLIAWSTSPQARFSFLLFPAIIPMAAVGIRRFAAQLWQTSWFRFLTIQGWMWAFTIIIVLYSNFATRPFILIPGA